MIATSERMFDLQDTIQFATDYAIIIVVVLVLAGAIIYFFMTGGQ